MRYNIEAKASMHVGKKYSITHNLRTYDANKWNKDGHIQSDRTPLNVVLTNTDLKSFFKKTFGAAIEQFNEKNKDKHPERLTSVDEYYNKYRGHAQECIMQMGDHESYLKLVEKVGQDKADEIHQEFLTRTYQNWITDNPSLKVFSATIHMDETKDGTPHIHLGFLPVAESSRGLTVKVSMDGAMKQLGLNRKTKAKDGQNDSYSDTPYKRWLSQQRERVEALTNEYLTLIPSEPFTKRRRQETWQWRAQQKEVLAEDIKQLSQNKEQAEKDIEQLRTEYKQYRDLEVSTDDISQKIKVKSNLFSKSETVTLDKADFDILQEQSAAYIANRDRIQELDERERKLAEAEKDLEHQKKANENYCKQVADAAREKKKEAEALIKEYEDKVALSNSYVSRAEAKYREQQDLNKRYQNLQYLINEKREEIASMKTQMEKQSKLHIEEKNSFSSENQALKSELNNLRNENSKLKLTIEKLKSNFFVIAKRLMSIANYLKRILKNAELPNLVTAQIQTTQEYAEHSCREAPLDPDQDKILKELLEKNFLLPSLQDRTKSLLEELNIEHTQSFGRSR